MVKSPPADAGDVGDAGSIPAEGHGNPRQYFYLENAMDRGAWQATVHRDHKESDRTEGLTLPFVLKVEGIKSWFQSFRREMCSCQPSCSHSPVSQLVRMFSKLNYVILA